MRRHTIVTLLLATTLTGLVLTACQSGPDVVMWGPCGPGGDPTGTDGVYSMVCRDGVWTPIMTVGEWASATKGEDIDIAPLPERPTPPTESTPDTTTTVAPTTSTTSTTTTSTTTTSVPGGLISPSGGNWRITGSMSNTGQLYFDVDPAPGPPLDAGFISFSDPSMEVAGIYYVDGNENRFVVVLRSSASPLPTSFTAYVDIPGYETNSTVVTGT